LAKIVKKVRFVYRNVRHAVLYPNYRTQKRGTEGGYMVWVTIGKITGIAATVTILYLILKEILKVMRESSEGRCSEKCDLD
jgi:hypothetical protein